MAAPKGNQFWRLGNAGRKKIFETPEALAKSIAEYCKMVDETPWEQEKTITRAGRKTEVETKITKRPYTQLGFCAFAGVSDKFLTQFYKREREKKTPEALAFVEIVETAQTFFNANKIEGAMVGAYNQSIVAKLMGLVDKKDLSNSDNSLRPVIIASSASEQEKIKNLLGRFDESD